MKYEIKETWNMKDGRTIKDSNIATDVVFTTRNGLEAIKFIKEGKTRYTWVEIPNDYQMKKFVESFELIITEATTGRRIHTIKK